MALIEDGITFTMVDSYTGHHGDEKVTVKVGDKFRTRKGEIGEVVGIAESGQFRNHHLIRLNTPSMAKGDYVAVGPNFFFNKMTLI